MATVVMTAREIRKKYPMSKELIAEIKALQDADIEPFMDEDSPEMPDLPEKKPSLFANLLNRLRGRIKAKTAVC